MAKVSELFEVWSWVLNASVPDLCIGFISVRFARVNRDICRIYVFDKVSQYRRRKHDKVFTGMLAFIKDVGCDKRPRPPSFANKQNTLTQIL